MQDDVPEEEKTRRIVELQAVQRDIQTAWHESMVGTQRSMCSWTLPADAGKPSCLAGRLKTQWSTFLVLPIG